MSESKVLRHQIYSSSGSLYIRTLGTEEWMKPPHFEGSENYSSNNVLRPTFTPGSISVIQQTKMYDIVDDRLTSPLYM